MTDQRFVVTRTIAADPHAVFAVLADPARHQDTEPGDWVRDAIDPEPITAAGQMFVINMFLEQAGGHYVMHNLITDYVPDRTIGWLPGSSTSPVGTRRADGGGVTTWHPKVTPPTSPSPTTGPTPHRALPTRSAACHRFPRITSRNPLRLLSVP